MPWKDWQFWVVTLLALLAGLYLLRESLPARISPFKKRGKSVRTGLTISGKAVEKPRK